MIRVNDYLLLVGADEPRTASHIGVAIFALGQRTPIWIRSAGAGMPEQKRGQTLHSRRPFQTKANEPRLAEVSPQSNLASLSKRAASPFLPMGAPCGRLLQRIIRLFIQIPHIDLAIAQSDKGNLILNKEFYGPVDQFGLWMI